MGVLHCDRNFCDNIMCDRYSHRYGYICDECFAELLESDLTIEAFMQTEKHDIIKTSRVDELNNEFEMYSTKIF